MTITAKDFAQKMIEWYEDQSGTDSTAQAAELAAALGITVAPEKPEPGWYVVESGQYFGCGAQVVNGRLGVYASGLSLPVFYHEHNTWPELRRMVPEPARVVPAEPVELSEAEVGEIYEAESKSYHWDKLPTSSSGMRPKDMQQDIILTVNAALREHGHGRVFHQSTIEDALRVGLKGTGEDLSPEARQHAADAVYRALLGGDDRG